MADAREATAASGVRPAASDQPQPRQVSEVVGRARLRSIVLGDDGDEEDDEEDEDDRHNQRIAAMALRTPVVRAHAPPLASRSATTVAVEATSSPRPPLSATPSQSREQRVSSAGDVMSNRPDAEWGVDGEEGWMPKPARLHSGKTRSCAVCFSPLQYSSMQSWDEFVQSPEYLQQLQDNLLSDSFISSLICGESVSGGDLPTEHRMHKNRKQKCRQSVHDYVNMTSAGVIDQGFQEKSSVRILEEMLLHGLSTPLYSTVLERRLAVISHSTGIARKLMHESHAQRIPREVASSSQNVELHHLAIQTLSALLQSFDYSSNAGSTGALHAFEEMARLLRCFPALSLYSFWSPAQQFPEKPLELTRTMVDASSCASTPRLFSADLAIDGLDGSYWQSQQRPGQTYFSVRHPNLCNVSSLSIKWHQKCFPKTVAVQYRRAGSEEFVDLLESPSSATGLERFELRLPSRCEEVRLVMSGIPASNRSACYAIEDIKLNVPVANSLFVDPKTTIDDISTWFLGAVTHPNVDVVVEAIGAMRAWTLATASLGNVLMFIKLLLTVKSLYAESPIGTQGIVTFAINEANCLLKTLQSYRMDEMERAAKGGGRKSRTESRKIRALFEPSCCSAGVTIEDAGMAVRTRETSYQYAAVNAGISSGRATWRFRLDNDTIDDEMTCFGAAILPVTVSGYDSSPSLWMLRGYNGNLYARGHKLSRSIGKVHPGDTVQIDVDMNEGTLGYKINDTDFGIVFTDLAGHEVYPAVSFYGSGKVITLLSVEKWDDAETGSATIDPIFLSNLEEYHYYVGYGTLGKGTQLGYASDADGRSTTSTAPQNGTIRVAGEPKQRSLSTHPPARGDAFVMYDLARAYTKLVGSVGINDDVQNDILHQRAVSVLFSVVGDGVTLWQSKPISQVRLSERFEIDVQNVRILQLRVSCPGSNQCAHAVWIDPHLIVLEEWKCDECGVLNKGSADECTLCKNNSKVEKLRTTLGESCLPVVESLDESGKIQPTSPNINCNSSIDHKINAVLAEVVNLTRLGRESTSESDKNLVTRFEQPFCRQPTEKVLLQLLQMIRRNDQNPIQGDAETEVHRTRSLHALGLLQANLSSIASYDVSANELGIQNSAIKEIRCALEEIACVLVPLGDNACEPDDRRNDLEAAAARALIAGLGLLYTPREKVELLQALLKGCRETSYPRGSAKHLLLISLLQVLSQPGRDGVLNFLPTSKLNDAPDSCSSVRIDNIEDVVSVLIATACTVEQNEEGPPHPSEEMSIPKAAMRLLQSYQLMLLAEAVEVTTKKSPANVDTHFGVRLYIQEATIKFSSLLLRYCGSTVAMLVEQHAEEALLSDSPGDHPAGAKMKERAHQLPILSTLLPWLISSLCLLRRQSWLAVSLLPSIVKFSGILDQFCFELSTVRASESRLRSLERFVKARAMETQELERMLATDSALATHHQASKPMYNVFKQLYTGDKDHFEGQIGFQFEATSTFSIIALGRSVNPVKNGGQLVRQHTIRLWDEASQQLIAQVTVGATSRKDTMGYAFEPLQSPTKLTQGKLYRLTTQEFANGGDPWYKKENLPDEEYDSSYIKILRDCYASGSTSFPNSQNLSGAAYGVPTFLVEGENLLKRVPRFIPPYGSTGLRFSSKRKSFGTMISHSGKSAQALDSGSDLWRSCFLQTAAYCGHHSVDFVVKCSKAGGVSSGHVCVGAEWSSSPPLAGRNNFLGTSRTSFGWMPSIGSVWVMGKRIPYGPRKQVNAGDILTVTIDYDHELVSFALNGTDFGVAIGAEPYAPHFLLSALPTRMCLGISLNGTLDVAQVRPAGICGSTLRLHWLLDLHNSVASLAGRVCSTLIAGNPVDGVEEELLPWLQSPLLSGGISTTVSSAREELPEWGIALQEEEIRWKEASANSSSTAVLPMSQVERILRPEGISKIAKRSSFFDDLGLEESIFLNELVKDMSDSGPSAVIISWLEKVSPDRSFLSRLGKFPTCERPMCAALIKHSPAHLLHEVQAIISSSTTAGGHRSVEHIDLVPSDDLALIWKRIIMLRHWLIKTRQEYRAKAANDEPTENTSEEDSVEDKESTSELEIKISVARSFDDLISQIHERASFLCMLNPPSEERQRLKVESQIALSDLAEKWSSQKTPPSLEPMLERWRSLSESDSSKWSGIVDVLRAQHRWRTRRASVSVASRPVEEAVTELIGVEEDDEDDQANTKPAKYRDSFDAVLRACDLYIRNGIGAPPDILRALLDRRQRRSECRVFGLDAMRSLLTSLSMNSTRHNAVIFLRPAFRGFSEDEKESRDLNDGQIVAESFRATVRHHYLKGLEGCSRRTVQRVQSSFWSLYSILAGLIASGGSSIDASLKQAIICAWCLDFESKDHSFILKSGFLSTLQNEFSLGATLQRTQQEVDDLRLLQQAVTTVETLELADDLNWQPLSDEFVQRSALSSGMITKRDIMLLILRAPRYACTKTWWQENLLIAEDASVSASGAAPASVRHTVSSMSLRYSEVLTRLQSKLSWCDEQSLGRKVLQFGVTSAPSSSHQSSPPQAPKLGQVSYAEVPALGEVANFTMEMWVFPTELGGYRVLRADNGFHTGSVYVELVDRFLHVAINGNHPREQLFNTFQLETHTWNHVAIVYKTAAMSITYYVNGVHVETKSYSRVNKAIVFRESRIGCWMGDAGDSAAASVGPQRVFKGFIAEIRLWRVPRSSEQIRRDFQLAVPNGIERMDPGPPISGVDARNATNLLGLWHLDEGEGVCGNNRVETTGTEPSQRIMETAGCNASLVACHWAHANVPVWSGVKISSLSPDQWQQVVSRISAFQRCLRLRFVKKWDKVVERARSTNRRDELALMNDWADEEDIIDEDDLSSRWKEHFSGGGEDTTQGSLEKVLAASTDDVLLHHKSVKKCAWIVFRFLAHVAICGTQERSDSEASSVAAAAKSRRKLRISPDSAATNIPSPMAGGGRAKATLEENEVSKTAELASDVAKSAATNRKLEEPVLQNLWFSGEVHRKIFEVIEKELGYATAMIQTAEGLTRAQRMVRSTSTPVQDREIAIRQQQSVVVHGSNKRNLMRAALSTSGSENVVLEPLEVEMHVFSVLSFVLSQSTSQVALNHLARPRILRELLQLLRLGSPRSQRIVKLLLRKICASGTVGPSDIAEIWGSESVLVDLLLDQVAESVCSTAAPLPSLGLSVSAATAAAASTSGDNDFSSLAPITESLSNPVGFRSGQVYLAAASESVALLRLLMTDRRWGPVVADLLSGAIKNVTPILARRRSQGIVSSENQENASDIRVRTAIIRAVGALCVLGSHTDCIRIGGKIEVTANKSQTDGKTMIDYGFNFSGESGTNGRSALATLIELNGRASTARVVFNTSVESDPSHNVQEVDLATVSPVEEVQLSGESAPLSIEMMPVILKLASLDDSDVISSFDELWQMQIRSRALLAFESILRYSSQTAQTVISEMEMPKSLLEAALSPVTLSTFVSVPFLQERGRMILCRLIEASTPFGEPMFRGLPEPQPFQPDNAEDENIEESSNDPVEEETEEYRVRRGFASTLAAMGFEFDLCMAALENSRNDPNLAVEWLMGSGAIEYQERQEARRLAAATIASRRTASTQSGSQADGEMTLEAKAEELQGISGMPFRLALSALELSNADPNRAMEWLMEHGHRYEKAECMGLLSDEMHVENTLVLKDSAALEGIDQPDPLVASTSHEASVNLARAPASAATLTADDISIDTTNIMAVTLAPILARLPEKPSTASKKKKVSDSSDSTGGFAALDPNYLSPYVLLTVSDEIGPVQRLSATGRTGVFRTYSPRDGVLITFLNTETGAYEDEWYTPKDVRRITRIYDEVLDGVPSIHRVALRTEKALSTHYARRGVAALLRAWDTFPLAAVESSHTLADTVLSAVGGPRQFVNLLKLVAASEMVFSRNLVSNEVVKKKVLFPGPSGSSKARKAHEDPVSILHDLQTITLRILREEAQCGKIGGSTSEFLRLDAESKLGRLESVDERVSVISRNKEFVQDSVSSAEVISASGEEITNCTEAEVEDNELDRAIALSMEETKSTEDEKRDDEEYLERLYSNNPRSMRSRQPSYTEAQKSASAYLGGTINDHDGLLSSVLVKECVSHCVESTRVAGDGGGAATDTMEFQSLHPYYGRCDYTRAVVLDKTHRCVRIKFDKRCKLGPKAKLSFFADAACEKVITTVDASSTNPPPGRTSASIPDVMIQSNRFWFRFSASEEDPTRNLAYGFRFQVKPVQSISWANEGEVQTNPSLEWACWVLEFLLNEATDLFAHGAVHNRKMYGALVRYIRSPGAPFKARVVRLLIQLLYRPDQFPIAEIPDLEPLKGIARLALNQAKAEKMSGKVFLSSQLLQLVELAMATRRAEEAFAKARALVTNNQQFSSRIISENLVVPTPIDRRELTDILSDLSAIASFLLGQSDDLPPHVLMAIWLDVYGSTHILETEHPYAATTKLTGTVEFPGAQALLAIFDSRCETAPGTELKLRIMNGTQPTPDPHRGAWSFSGRELWPSGAVDLSGGSKISYSFVGGENPDARFGFSVCISAPGLSKDQQVARSSVDKLEDMLKTLQRQRDKSSRTYWTATMDGQLVDWVNTNVEGPSGGTGSSSSAASVDLKPTDIRIHRKQDALRCAKILDTSLTQLHLRFSLLKHFNLCLKHTLPLIDLRDTSSPWTMAYTLRQLGHCIFFDIKNSLVEAAIDATSTPGDTNSSTSTARIILDRLQALESRDDREVEPSVSDCFFAQAFRQLHQVDPSSFRRKIDNKGRLFSVKFLGEEGVDWGGVYREGVNSMVDDLFSPHFNLFVLCPNGQHDTGTNRAMYLPNPKCTSPVAIQMFEFVGKLLGISLRTHGDFPFAFPSLVWKQLIGQPLDRADLEGTDAMFVQMLDGIQNCERDGIITADEFDTAFEGLDLRFTAFDCNGQEVELVEGGKTKRVDYSNRLVYCELAEAYRLQESAKQVAAMARGLATVFPLRVLTLLTSQEVEMLTCGSPKIDIALWKQHTRYDGYSENDETVKLFWEAMASFTDEQRSDFVRFAWGRSRLPRGKWPQPFKLTKKGGRDSTLSLPVAHTCFFSVELPPYTTLDKMTSMLLATINFGLGGILMA